jgi:pimeloyl-ACP methyl ester carboxylesterase
MTASGMPQQAVEDVIGVLTLQYRFARTGEGWNEYASAREKLAARMGSPPDTIPGTPDHPYWQFIRRLYFYDPVPTLRQLKTPTLALWGELDNNILAGKKQGCLGSRTQDAGNRDFTLTILPSANHSQWEAKIGSNAETKSLQRFQPGYFTSVETWLGRRVPGFTAASR